MASAVASLVAPSAFARRFHGGYTTPQASTPTFSPAGGSYGSTQTVTISCSTGSSTIYYTTDGTDPTTSSSVYSTALTVSTTTTVKAIATAAGYTQSAVGTAVYTISGGGGAFDYYIATTGDDNNAGTLVSPWSITALNSKQSTYAGKRVGLVAGTYQHGTVGGTQTTLYSLIQAVTDTQKAILGVQGGPSSSSLTYIGSSDSSGNYSARVAIIDCSNPAGGALPTTSGSVIGQTSTTPNVTAYGNATIDGIVVKNFTYAGIIFGGPSTGAIVNTTVQNCEVYDQQNVVSNNNPGAIWVQNAQGFILTNCKMHDLQSNGSGSTYAEQANGYIQFISYDTTITNCTTYNCCAGFSQKNNWQSMNISYCYIGYGTFGAPAGTNLGSCINNYLTGTGVTVNFHHNIVLGPVSGIQESSGAPNEGTVNIYNNTFYHPSASGYGPMCGFVNTDTGVTGEVNFYNNLVWSDRSSSPSYEDGDNQAAALVFSVNSSSAIAVGTCNYNCYGSNSNGVTFGTSFTGGQDNWSLATWQGKGFDLNSTSIASTPFSGTPAEPSYTTFAITGAATTAGMSGTPCGALDGSGPIGCNF